MTVDAAVLALKAGNAAVLRGGRGAVHTNERLVELFDQAPGLPEGAIELLDSVPVTRRRNSCGRAARWTCLCRAAGRN